jgi:glycosyltransferase involved in cell wall biosynthesis
MNLAVSDNLASVGSLPGFERTGRLRLLCLTMKFTGLRSFGLEMRAYLEGREDVEAVHVTYFPPLWVKGLSAHVPLLERWDMALPRTVQAWRLHLSWWLRRGGPLDLRRFDAVVCTSQFMGLAAADARSWSGCRVVLFGDSTTMNNIRDLGFDDAAHRALVRVERGLFEGADLIAMASRWALRSVAEDYGQGEEKTVLAPPTAGRVPPRAAREPRRPVRMVFIGNSFVRKGGDRVVRWHQSRWADRVELHVCSAEARADLGCRNVVWHGRVDRERLLRELLPTMDVLVMPTTSDQSCWPAVEAQMAGVVPVLTRVGGIPELVEDGVTGMLAEKGDEAGFVGAVESLLDDPVRLERMGRCAQERAPARFGREIVLGRLIDRIRERAGLPTDPPTAAATVPSR